MASFRSIALALLIMEEAIATESRIELTPSEQQWLQNHPIVRYAIDSYWPLEYVADGKHQGLTSNFLDEITKISGLRFEMVSSENWVQTLELLAKGEIDLTTSISKELIDSNIIDSMLLSDVFFVGTTVVVTRSGYPILFSPNKLNGKTVAVKGGGAYEHYLRKKFPDITLLLLNDPEEALNALVVGEADAVIGLDCVLQLIIARKFFGKLHVAGVLSDMPVISSMGVHPNAVELQSIINKSLAVLPNNTIDKIVERWLERTDFGAPSWATIFHYYTIEFVIFLILIVLLIIMTRRAIRAKKAAEHSEHVKSNFLAMMSHEIRTPMNGILSSIELLKNTPLSEAQCKLTKLANVSARNLLELLDDVLDSSKLEADKINLELVPTDLFQLVETLVNIHQIHAKSRDSRIVLEVKGLNDVLVLIDPVRVRQILTNLLSNAVKFTHAGEIIVNVELNGEHANIQTLELSVRDTGVGIELTQQCRLFQAFVQANTSITRRYGGSGLGLSICKQLTTLMRGKIDLQSQPGKGTCVTLSLPVGVEPLTQTDYSRNEKISEITEAGQSCNNVHSRQVLVIEDHDISRQTIKLQLSNLGYTSIIAGDGKAGLTALQVHDDISLILLDYHLPDMDGYEVAHRIRLWERAKTKPRTPTILISASSSHKSPSQCAEHDIDGKLGKPIELLALQQVLELWLPHTFVQYPSPPTIPNVPLRRLFEITSQEDVALLREAIEKNDQIRAAHYAHRLHGAALTVGAIELAKLAGDLDRKLREFTDIKSTFSVHLNAIEKEIKNLPSAAP